jgi:NAD-dependent deacetylase
MQNETCAVRALLSASVLVVFTGAGISAGSGIATYREPLTGIWAQHDPQTLETANAFRANPPLVWGWYLWRRQQVTNAQPNAAHRAVYLLAATGRKVSFITQNVGDLHERAGSVGVLHLHGSLCTPKCFACHRPGIPPQQQVLHPADLARLSHYPDRSMG